MLLNKIRHLVARLSRKDARIVQGEMFDDTEAVRDRFLSKPDDPLERLTYLQMRMQSGGT